MNKFRSFFFTFFILSMMTLLNGCHAALLDPKGMIAMQQKHLLITSVLLMLIVVIPVIILSLTFVFRYKETHLTSKYDPNWGHSSILEIIWWSIPCIIIFILAVITWQSSHQLDPYRPLASNKKTLTIQVVALNWKWLFIYPKHHIATVNYIQIPVNTPVRFLITADAPMNSFAIPRLAGQIYAMAGMQTKLNIIANETGHFRGLSTNFSGEGFAHMKFLVNVTSKEDFNQWLSTTTQNTQQQALTMSAYNQLALPSEKNPIQYFYPVEDHLFSNIIMKYMMPMPNMSGMKNTVNDNDTTVFASKADHNIRSSSAEIYKKSIKR